MNFIARLEKRYKTNRVFFDALCLLVWCETAIPFAARREDERQDWQDVELPFYCSLANMHKAAQRGERTARVSAKSGAVFRTPKQVLTADEMNHLQAFIDAHHTEDVTLFRRMAKDSDVFSECMTVALNEVRHIPYARLRI